MNTPETEKAGPTTTEILKQTYVDDRGREVNPDEVRPVKPIELDTPEQLLEKERAAHQAAKEQIAALEAKLTETYADAKVAVNLAAHWERDCQAQKARVKDIAADRNRWKERAEKAEASTIQDLPTLLQERAKLREEISGQARVIADLQKRLHQISRDAVGSLKEARAAEQRAKDRAESMQATLLAMQKARDQAEKDRDLTQQEKGELIKASAKWRERAEAAEKELAELKKPKAPAAAAPVRKGA